MTAEGATEENVVTDPGFIVAQDAKDFCGHLPGRHDHGLTAQPHAVGHFQGLLAVHVAKLLGIRHGANGKQRRNPRPRHRTHGIAEQSVATGPGEAVTVPLKVRHRLAWDSLPARRWKVRSVCGPRAGDEELGEVLGCQGPVGTRDPSVFSGTGLPLALVGLLRYGW